MGARPASSSLPSSPRFVVVVDDADAEAVDVTTGLGPRQAGGEEHGISGTCTSVDNGGDAVSPFLPF